MKRLFLIGVFLCAIFSLAQSEEREDVILFSSATLEFTPQTALFFVLWEGVDEPVVRSGVLTSSFREQDDSSQAMRDWYAGIRVTPPSGVTQALVSILFEDEKGNFFLLTPQAKNLAPLRRLGTDPDRIRERLLLRKRELAEQRDVLEREEQLVKRLKSDAELIGNYVDTGEMSQEQLELDERVKYVDEQITQLRNFLRLASKESPPLHFSRRKAELSKEIRELAELARETEASERSRESEAFSEMERKRELIEETRYESERELEQVLFRLRERRQRLESQRTPAGNQRQFDEYSADGI